VIESSVMATEGDESQVFAVKDTESERPIPTAWRPVLKDIVSALVRHDYQLSAVVGGVLPVSTETAEQIRKYIASYGEVLTELPEAAWSTSVCIWTGSRWDALIDLWTVSEGRSDLVLSVRVPEDKGSFIFSVYMVYVP
jgi:hypothetical protein